ncbi:HNH endonuclease [Nocardia fusca]|uniref:HNH endonuclease n=1 Tax=Nocardia fusca TaxID=941183 RepID=UPI0037C92653
MPSKDSAALRQIARSLKLRRAQPCFICRQPIDYRLPHDDPEAFTVEHIKPRSTHPHLELEPSNCAPAHASCNKSRGNSEVVYGLGRTSEQW